MKIVILDGHALNPGDLSWDCLSEFGEVAVYPRTAPEEVARRIGDAQIVLLNKTAISAEILDACPSVQLICVLATGYNVVDCDAARRRGVAVCNVPSYGTHAVAQFTFGLLLEVCHQIGRHDALVKAGKWTACPDFCFWDTPQTELFGKTMGIVGFGRIGQAVGRIARAMGMTVLAHNRSRSPEGAEIGQYVDLDTLYAASHVISLHCPLTVDTAGLIGPVALKKIRDGAILINTARGSLIDEAAVASALRRGKLRGYGADVAAREPIPADSPLLTAPNCVLTPHMAWAPIESRQRILDCTAGNIRAYLAGSPMNVVN